MRLEQADGVAHLLSQLQQLGRGLDVRGQAEVRLLGRDQAQQVRGEGPRGGQAGARPVGAGEGRVRRHGGRWMAGSYGRHWESAARVGAVKLNGVVAGPCRTVSRG
jgi:hypothetical protein